MIERAGPIAALLAPGPSLREYPGPDGFDLVAAVNRAAAVAAGTGRCDLWVMADAYTFGLVRPDRRPEPDRCTIVTSRREAETMHRDWPAARTYAVRDARSIPRAMGEWAIYSVLIGLLACAESRPAAICVYGVDRSGQSDWDGTRPARARRHEKRWRRERRIWNEIVATLTGEGIQLRCGSPVELAAAAREMG